MTPTTEHEVTALEREWSTERRWSGVERDYSADEVVKLRGSLRIEYTLARHGAERLWDLLQEDEPVRTFGAMTGAQAVEMVRAGLKAIYLSGWQVAADANLAGQTYPDQSLYPSNSVPALVRRLNNALLRADRRRRGGGFRRAAARVRAHEVDDRSGCGRRAFRGPARV